jgi:hypothetical protein
LTQSLQRFPQHLKLAVINGMHLLLYIVIDSYVICTCNLFQARASFNSTYQARFISEIARSFKFSSILLVGIMFYCFSHVGFFCAVEALLLLQIFELSYPSLSSISGDANNSNVSERQPFMPLWTESYPFWKPRNVTFFLRV